MSRPILLFAVVLPLLAPRGTFAASPADMRGVAEFAAAVSPRPVEVDSGGVFGLGAWAESSGHRPSALAEVTVTLPPSFQVIQGQLSRKNLHVDVSASRKEDRFWSLQLRALTPGDYAIDTDLRIVDGKIRDESEWRTNVHVGDTVTVQNPSEVWSEREEGGRRYRYGGRYMVLLDGNYPKPLHIDQEPVPLVKPDGICAKCDAPDSLVIPVAITVGSKGSVTWVIRPEVSIKIDPHVIAAAESAIRKWRFQPATAQGVPVAQWAIAHVVVRTKKDRPSS